MEEALITKQFGLDLQNLVLKDRGTPQHFPRERSALQSSPESKIFVLLLEDIESGQSAKAARLVPLSFYKKQLITVYGLMDSSATFDIEWNSETVSGISIYATPLELKAKLGQFSFINAGDVGVMFGNHTREVDEQLEEYQVFRWIVQLDQGVEDFGLMEPTIAAGNHQTWLGSEWTFLEDTDESIDVYSVLPVGVDIENKTPMQAGAICTAFFSEEPGWCLDAIEARSIATDFVEIPVYG